MPTFHANEVTARLAVCDLTSTLSGCTNQEMRKESAKDLDRTWKTLKSAINLPERVLGDILKGWDVESERGALRFIGPNGDLPLFVVETGEFLDPTTQIKASPNATSCNDQQQDTVDSPVVYSSLTSLASTPPIASPLPVTVTVDSGSASSASFHSMSPSVCELPSIPVQASATTSSRHRDADTKALVLRVNLGGKAFQPPSSYAPSRGNDLKIETFVNGHLCDVHFINARRFATKNSTYELQFAGLRVERQRERALLYASAEEVRSTHHTAQNRWNAVTKSLVREGQSRGRNKFNSLSPSAEVLVALGALELPRRCSDQHSLGVVDVVITAGRGRKCAPGTPYVTCPTQMHDPKHNTREVCGANSFVSSINLENAETPSEQQTVISRISSDQHSQRLSIEQAGNHVGVAPLTPPANQLVMLRNDCNDVNLTIATPAESIPKPADSAPITPITMQLRPRNTKEMGTGEQSESATASTNETSNYTKKRKRVAGSTLMNSKRRKSLRVRDKFVEAETITVSIDPTAPPANSALLGLPADHLPDKVEEGCCFRSPSQIIQQPRKNRTPSQMLTRSRINLSDAANSDENGHSIRSISPSTIPKAQRRMKCHDRRSCPTSWPIMSALRENPQRPFSPGREMDATATVILPRSDQTSQSREPFSHDAIQSDQHDEIPSANGQLNEALSDMQTVDRNSDGVLQRLKLPASFEGSRVTFADRVDAERQICKTRSGEFAEEELVVVMRFVVI